MHRLNERDRILHWRLLHNAVAEVEDMAGAARGLIEDLLSAAANFGFAGQ